MQVAHPEGQEVQLPAPAAEKEPLAQAAQAADPPAENSFTGHWVHALFARPYPVSQVWQAEASVQAEHPVGQEVQLVAPAAEKEPVAQSAQAAEPPAENWLTRH